MKYSMSLKSEIFSEAVENFDTKLRSTLAELLKRRTADGAVTLKVSAYLVSELGIDEDGIEREAVRPVFVCSCTSAVTQKTKDSTPIERDLKLRVVDGQLELRDLDENTLFDMTEAADGNDA